MPIELVKFDNAPKIKRIKMNCDIPISTKLTEIAVIKDYFNKANTTVIVGRQGSGKTSILMNFVKIYKKCFHKIYVFMRESSRASLHKNVFDDELPPEQLFEDLTFESISKVYAELKQNTKEGWFSWLIFDDVQDALKDTQIVNVLNKIVANQRHLKAVNFLILQNFFALDNKIRKLVNNLFIFHLDKKQMDQVYDTYIETKEKNFIEITKKAFEDEHDFMLINLNNQRFFNRDFEEFKIVD